MPVPVFVQAGTGVATLTGSGTVSLTGCTAGNIIMVHVAARGVSLDYSLTAVSNIENIAGTASSMTGIVSNTGQSPGILHEVNIGRATANGTVSLSQNVGVSGEDLYGRLYEFSGVSTSTTAVGGVHENGATSSGRDVGGGSSTTPNFTGSPIITNGSGRLGLTFLALASNQAVGNFTGESGGYDLTEAVAEFASASGAACTTQLQTASMAAAGTLDNGTLTVGVSTDWGVVMLALIGAVSATPPVAWLRA